MGQLPLLSEEGLLHALSMLYRQHSLENILVIKRYLDHPNLTVRMNTLDVMCETIVIASNRDEDIEAKLRPKQYHQLCMMINNAERRKLIPEAELAQQFLTMLYEVMAYIELCFKHYNLSSE